MKVILASASPRRRELLSRIIKEFEIVPATSEERADYSLSPEELALRLAEAKCDEVFEKYPDCAVVGCDTVVVFNGKIYGKPKDKDDAKATLSSLSGKVHYVITGVCVRSPYKKVQSFDKTEVRFNALTEKFIDGYVAMGSPMDKAGSYGIQDEGVVGGYCGSYTNVLGMPVALVKTMLDDVCRNG